MRWYGVAGSIFAVLVAAGSAQAADLGALPVKAPVALPQQGWGGSYVGVQGGGAWGNARQTDGLGFDSGRYDLSGGFGGITWGRNWQINNNLVLGIESDLSAGSIKGSTTAGACAGITCASQLNWLSTTRGRAGWVLDGTFMPYVTGGFAWGVVHGSDVGAGAFGAGTAARSGWTLGAGLETKIAPNWTAKVEYLYADLGSGEVFDSATAAGLVSENVDVRTHLIRAGLNYLYDPDNGVATSRLVTKAPAAPNWTGTFIGAFGGGVWGTSAHTGASGATGTFDVSGGTLGGVIGSNFQTGAWVLGLDSDIGWADARRSATAPGGALFESNLQWLSLTRARVGYASGPFLPYVTGGVAFGGVKSAITLPGASAVSATGVHTGWTAGAGLEYAITPNLSAKLEYLYLDFGSEPVLATDNVDFKAHMVRAGLNYKIDVDALLAKLR